MGEIAYGRSPQFTLPFGWTSHVFTALARTVFHQKSLPLIIRPPSAVGP